MTAGTPRPSRTFRIFVSSTFSDLKAERDALQRYVFPRLRELCARHGGRFQAIDLRWGVSEEAGLDQRTMPICLGEIERCQRMTPRPNFIILLGDRYGWRPPPPEIPATEFEQIAARVLDPSDNALLGRWYRFDENAIDPALYCLEPRRLETAEDASAEERAAAQDAEAAEWAGIQASLRRVLLAAVDGLGLDDDALLKYRASATEQEIVRGDLRVPGASEHVFGFFRKLNGLAESVPGDGSAGEFIDQVESDGRFVLDTEAHGRLEDLKDRLHDQLGGNIHEYQATWTREGVGNDHLGTLPEQRPDDEPQTALDGCLELLGDANAKGTLCVDVWRSLATAILRELERAEQADPLDAEIWAHDDFGKERSRHFTGRAEPLTRIASHLGGDRRSVFGVLGQAGSGKSALMAKAVDAARAAHPDANVFVRFIGATPASSEGRSLLGSLCREVSRAYGAETSDIPDEYNELAVELGKRLELASAGKPLILFLDALDQLAGAGRSLSWLPGSLPEHVHVIVSTLPGGTERALRTKHPSPEIYQLEAMSPGEGADLLGCWLSDAKRTLRDTQRKEVLQRFAAEGLPLYLRLAFEEARLWRSFAPAGQTRLADGIPALIRENLFKRLALPSNHGGVMVAHALGYLAASRYGLSEDEMIDVLSRDDQVKQDFRAHAPNSPETDQLPVVVWSRLYFDLQPYLTEHSAEGTTLLAFYHNQLRDAATEAYLEQPHLGRRNTQLADYFRHRSDPRDDRTWTGGYARGLSELPFHLANAGESKLEELYETMTDFTFLEHKAAEVGVERHTGPDGSATTTYTGVFQLQDDYELALERFGGRSVSAHKPLILTGVDFHGGSGLVIRCPWCDTTHPFDQQWRGKEINCPNGDCKGPLRINPFVVGESMFEVR